MLLCVLKIFIFHIQKSHKSRYVTLTEFCSGDYFGIYEHLKIRVIPDSTAAKFYYLKIVSLALKNFNYKLQLAAVYSSILVKVRNRSLN